jgi:hypothetical protein
MIPRTVSPAMAGEVAALLEKAGHSGAFEGGLELEVFCGANIKFAYPAVLALYHGARWQSAVHTYLRTYH